MSGHYDVAQYKRAYLEDDLECLEARRELLREIFTGVGFLEPTHAKRLERVPNGTVM